MRKIFLIAFSLVAPLGVVAQAEDPRILAIRHVFEKTNRQIVEAEKDFPASEIFLTELIVNRGGTMYPAVGNFKRTIRFFYTYGERERSQYPNRVPKIAVSTERSATRETTEYYFDPSGQLVFVFESDGEAESRYYYATGKLIRWQRGRQLIDIASRDAVEKGRSHLNDSTRLLKIFFSSLE